MNCPETRESLSAYVDGELPPERAAEMAEHLSSCGECAHEYEHVLNTVRTLRDELVRHRAPDVLRARVRAALREEQVAPAARLMPTPRRGWRVPWHVVAAALVVAVASSGITLLARGGRSSNSLLADEVLTSHIRSLMPEHLTDIRSSDQHNVKPWFNGRLDFSPAVPRLEEQGFPLLGGRVDYLHGRPVAVAVYGRRQHVINVFSWPDDADGAAAPAQEARHGYNLQRWRRDGMEFWAVSDLNAAELRQFTTLLSESGKSGAGAVPSAPAPTY
jgi:anti-sigma factor RsiW